MIRSPKLLLIAAVAWNLASLVLLVYRLMLPTDGWLVGEPDGFDLSGFIYHESIMGIPSELQPNDWITAVNDIPIRNGRYPVSQELVTMWQAGRNVRYTVQRDKQTLVIEVPLVYWQPERLLAGVVFADPARVASILGTAVFISLSHFAFWRRPDDPAARALLAIAASLCSLLLTLDLLPQTLTDLINPAANLAIGAVVMSSFSVLLPPALIRFGLVFPRPKPILQKRPRLVYLPYLVGALVIAAFVGEAYVFGWLWTGTAVLITLLLLLHSTFTLRDAISRGQLRWAMGGTILGLGFFALTYLNLFFVESSASPLGLLLTALSNLGFAVMGVGLTVAVLRYHLFGIDHIVNRALVYGGLTVTVVTVNALVVGYLSYLFQTEANLPISLVATGLVAVLFGWLRSQLQQGVNRLMYGQRDEPYHLLARLGQQVEAALDPTSALSLTVKTVAQALKLPYVAIALQQGNSLQTAAVFGSPPDEVTHFPLVYAGEPVGELMAAARGPQEAFAPADLRLLSVLARQISVAAHAVMLTANLEQARLQLVTERGEARRQLGSDLHDGVGHQLVGLTRQLEQSIELIAEDPVSAAALMAKIHQQLHGLTAQVRGLAHRLFPPELELLGLVEALREQCATRSSVRMLVDAPVSMPSLPAQIETAVYYIVLEAVTNVEKHARAQSCRIRLSLVEIPASPPRAVLEVDIRDDGCGMPSARKGGLGMLSMQARAAEVGGTCHFETIAGGGTAVTVHIPCYPMGE